MSRLPPRLRRGRAALLPLLVLPLAAAPVLAQPTAAADAIPREVVLALFGDGSPVGMELRVGQPAPEIPADLLEGALVLGSVSRPLQSTTAVVVPGARGAAMAAFEARATAAGWTRPPARPAELRPMMRGFQSSGDMGMAMMGDTGFCRGDRHLMPMATPWEGGQTLLRLMVGGQGMSGFTPCRVQEVSSAQIEMRSFQQDTIIPVLTPPPGARVQTQGTSGSMNRRMMTAEIVSQGGMAPIVAHYVEELRAAGWEPAAAAEHEQVRTHVFRRTHPVNQRPWQATLLVVERGGGLRGMTALLLLESQGEL